MALSSGDLKEQERWEPENTPPKRTAFTQLWMIGRGGSVDAACQTFGFFQEKPET